MSANCLHTRLSVRLSVCLPVYLYFCVSVSVSFCLLICQPVCIHVCVRICPSVYLLLSIPPLIRLSIYRPTACLSIFRLYSSLSHSRYQQKCLIHAFQPMPANLAPLACHISIRGFTLTLGQLSSRTLICFPYSKHTLTRVSSPRALISHHFSGLFALPTPTWNSWGRTTLANTASGASTTWLGAFPYRN